VVINNGGNSAKTCLKNEDSKMDNDTGVNNNDAATLALLAGGVGYGGYGRGGHGGGYGSLYTGNSVLAAQAHADGTATKEAIDGNADLIRAQANAFENAERSRQVSDLTMQSANNELRITDRINNIELNALRSQADTLVAINNNAKDAAACCCDAKLEAQKNACDTQKLVVEENAKTRELIQANALKEAERELDRADRRSNSSDTINGIASAIAQQTNTLVTLLNNNGGHHGK